MGSGSIERVEDDDVVREMDDFVPSSASGCTLSLCMIVRNEEDTLPQSLASARAFVDEIVVVDTGSTDRTPDVARAFDARVFDFPWCDDFAAARNQSIEHATSDWIFWMDADDVLPASSGHEIRRVIGKVPLLDAAFWVNVEQESVDVLGRKRVTRHGHVKLFPRHPQIRFRYRVHEQVAPSIQELGFPIRTTSAVVRHQNADRSAEGNSGRNARNRRLLELDLQDHPEDPFVLLGLAMACLDEGADAGRAIALAERAISGFGPASPTRLNAYVILATAYHRRDQLDDEMRTYLKAQSEFPQDAGLLLRLGLLSVRRGDWSTGEQWFVKCLRCRRMHVSVFHFPDVHARAVIGLGRVYIHRGDRARAEELWRRFLKREPKSVIVRDALTKSSLEMYRPSSEAGP